jgi:hypothetical protein
MHIHPDFGAPVGDNILIRDESEVECLAVSGCNQAASLLEGQSIIDTQICEKIGENDLR